MLQSRRYLAFPIRFESNPQKDHLRNKEKVLQ